MPHGLNSKDSYYKEKTPKQDWTFQNETATVAGYLCKKAVCKFRGRNYTAWYAPDIPIGNGPWKFGGLPGLILKVYDRDKFYVAECVRVENNVQKFAIKMPDYQRYKETERRKLDKFIYDFNDDYPKFIGMVWTESDAKVKAESKPATKPIKKVPYISLELE
jgi:GLPGLI family protein